MGLFEKIKTLAGRRTSRDSSMVSVRTTQRWLDSLPQSSEYETHHVLVEGLERFNGDPRGDVGKRIQVLRVMESSGMPMQDAIVAEYIDTPDSSTITRQTLWREAYLFWSQMGTAYMQFLKMVIKGEEQEKLKRWSTDIILKNLYYAIQVLRWEYFRGQRPNEAAWRKVHRIYRMAEIAGMSLIDVDLDGTKTNCTREYVLILLFDLANPHVFQPREVQNITDILSRLQQLPIPEISLRRDRHSHMIDLSTSLGAERIQDKWVPGKRLRYLEMVGVVSELEQMAANAEDRQTSLMCKQIARIVGRAGARRDSARRTSTGEMDVVIGLDGLLDVMQAEQDAGDTHLSWKLRDESRQGFGFILPEGSYPVVGELLLVRHQGEADRWQVVVVRWVRAEGQLNLLGGELLSKQPKLVNVSWQSGDGPEKSEPALFLPLPTTVSGVTSHLLLQLGTYMKGRTVQLHDGPTHYQLLLGDVIESHGRWFRTKFEMLT